MVSPHHRGGERPWHGWLHMALPNQNPSGTSINKMRTNAKSRHRCVCFHETRPCQRSYPTESVDKVVWHYCYKGYVDGRILWELNWAKRLYNHFTFCEVRSQTTAFKRAGPRWGQGHEGGALFGALHRWSRALWWQLHKGGALWGQLHKKGAGC